MPVAVITGGSVGLGRALTEALARRGWEVVIDGRHQQSLTQAAEAIGPTVHAVVGDVTDAAHRAEIVRAVDTLGRLDLLVHNASTLGPSPLPHLLQLDLVDFDQVWRTNVAAPLALSQLLLPRLLTDHGVLISITSDAAVEHYEGWGAYGGAKAALDHLTLTLAAEHPGLAAYAVDPGDMRTAMHQRAFPGEDISDRPTPETVVPGILRLWEARPEPGRYRAADVRLTGSGAAHGTHVSSPGGLR